jgi:nucleotide-binding universal stress UspA family protein
MRVARRGAGARSASVVASGATVTSGLCSCPATRSRRELRSCPARRSSALSSRADQAKAAGLVCKTHSLQGFPPGELVGHAKKAGAELIVVGTHGRTGIAHAILGSTAERVVQRAFCPVLVIPAHRTAN